MSTKTKKKFTLPKGLPKLPEPPTGCQWQYMGTRWHGTADNYIFVHDSEMEWCENEGMTSGGPCHYCRAIKRPAPANKQPKAKAVKAYKMFANYFEGKPQTVVTTNKTMGCTIPVAVIDISNPDALVKHAAKNLLDRNDNLPASSEAITRKVLVSIGIIPKRKGAK